MSRVENNNRNRNPIRNLLGSGICNGKRELVILVYPLMHYVFVQIHRTKRMGNTERKGEIQMKKTKTARGTTIKTTETIRL